MGSGAIASDSKKISMIEDLLADRDGDGRIDRLGEQVTVRGRATVGDNVFDDEYLILYVQDQTAGIMVFSDMLDVPVSKGDSLQVTGTLKLHASKPEIVVEDLKILKSGNRVPEAKPLSRVFKNPDDYRGLLVSGEAVIQRGSTPKDIKMLRIAPTTGSDDSLHIFVSRSNVDYEDFNFNTLGAGERIHIRGILIRYISDYNGEMYYQVLPRRRDDLTINNLQPMLEEGAFIYADIDTTSGTIYMLLQSGLWGYNLSGKKWRFLDALADFEGAFSTYEFGFNARTNLIQLWSRGMGKLFNIDPKTYEIERVDQSSEHRNQFGHFPFYRDSTLYAFGGYGFWDYHNMMIHFNHPRNEWRLQAVDQNSPYPSRRIPRTGIFDQQQDRLYIFGGWGTDSGYSEDRNSRSQEFQDIWSFSFGSQKWKKIMTLEQRENGSGSVIHPSKIGEINKQSSSLYLPDEQMWFIPTFDPEPLDDAFYFRAVHLPSHHATGLVSPDFDRSNKFMPTNYFYNPNEDEAVFVGIDNLTNTTTYPVHVHRMPADSLMANISNPPFYLSTKLYYYLIGLVVIGGFLFWFYRKEPNGGKVEEQESKNISYHSLLQASWYNSKEKKLLEYMHQQDRFLGSQEIEELLWSDIESYDYRRRLRNDILKEINRKFKKHYPGVGSIILRKKDPDDNRRYLYGLNKQFIEE
ncbi:hypothetical protein CK503_01740 [Aliifodinibius salipaludis]|uniref:Uncharacterized protein n=1 Tax=Fodinibius salipaludis TaxID=2032627 RepID=A0A2A2GDS7_9BACT|nr:hypothetical protein [Aliifodinibius salipaludis]PAU95806.1 hypothetical protein CK503_01740 [Aliifodinibius salipaludis]